MKLLKYNHPASMGYDTKKVYNLEDLKKDLSLDKIKILFTPIGWKFEDLEKRTKVKKLDKEINITKDEDRVD